MNRAIPLIRQAGLILAVVGLLSSLAPTFATAAAVTNRIDINTASAEALMSLPGIGPAIAQRIIEYRDKNGPFRRTVELMNVKGIGEKTFDRLKDRIFVSQDGGK